MEPLHNTHGRGVVLALLVVGFHVSGCGGGVSDGDIRLAASEVVEACKEVEAANAAEQTARGVWHATSGERNALIDQRIAEDEQLAAAQAEWSAKVQEAIDTFRGPLLETVEESAAWRKAVIDQLVADDHTLAGRLAELDGRVAEADERHTEARDRLAEEEGRMAEKAGQLVRANKALVDGMRQGAVRSTCERLLAADDPASEARSLLADGVATGKKAREIFELTSEFFEACPDGNPAGWDEGDWRAFIATGDRIMGAELPQVCDREENSAVWEMDTDLSGICSTFGADSSWWEAADKGRLTLLCQQAPRGWWEEVVEKVEEADLQLQT